MTSTENEARGEPVRMDRSRVAAELRFLAWVNPLGIIEHAWGRRLLRALAGLLPPLPVKGVTIEVVRGAPLLRIYHPKVRKTDAALLWIHGGGYVIGSPRTCDFRCGDICREVGITIVAVGQRLSPEHAYPHPSDDCLAAWHWLQTAAPTLRIDPARIAVGGVSSGGGLAAGLVQRIHDAGGIQPLAQVLLAPLLDDRTAARRELDAIKHPVWTNRLNRLAWRSYLGQEPGGANVPAYAAPGRRDDLSGLPTTLITTSDVDVLYEESLRYAERLKQHGVAVTLETVRGAPHGFEELARGSKMTRAYMAQVRDWLRNAVGASAATPRTQITS